MSQPVSIPAATQPLSAIPDTRLRGRWLLLARGGWLAVVICSLALFVGSLPTYYGLLQRPCVGAVACSLPGTLDAAGVQALQGAGFTLSGYAAYTILLTLITTLIWMVVGVVIFWRRSDDWVALLAAFVLMLTVLSVNGPTGVLAFVYPAWNLPVQVSNVLGQAAIALVLGVFPNGRFAPRWIRWVLTLFLIGRGLSIFPPADSPFNSNNWPIAITIILFLGTFATVIFSQIYRYRRRSTLVQRQQIKWAVFGIVLTLVLWIGVIVFEILVPFAPPNALLEAVINTLWLLTSLPIPIFIGIAILRSRLWDIDTIINKALVYGSLTALLGALYAGLIIGLENLAGLFGGSAAQNPVVLVVSTLAIAALFQPARRRLQVLIDRRFYRQKYDAEKTLAAFSATLRQEVDLEELRAHLLAAVQETMQPAHVSLWLRQPERHPPEQTHRLELRGANEDQTGIL